MKFCNFKNILRDYSSFEIIKFEWWANGLSSRISLMDKDYHIKILVTAMVSLVSSSTIVLS
jgi:hypothetical protein